MPEESVTVTLLLSSDVGGGTVDNVAVPVARFVPYAATIEFGPKGTICPAVDNLRVNGGAEVWARSPYMVPKVDTAGKEAIQLAMKLSVFGATCVLLGSDDRHRSAGASK